MSRHWLLLDVSYLCYRAYYSVGGPLGPSIGTLFGFFTSLVILNRRFNSVNMAFCFDSRRSHRKELFPEYKSGRRRDDMSEEERRGLSRFYKQVLRLRTELLPEIGFTNIYVQRGYEADDLIARIVRNGVEDDEMATIVSSDHDLYQLLDDNVRMWNPQKQRMMTCKQFERKYGIPPCRWDEVKAIAGDTSDNVSGIAGVGEKTALEWVRGTLDDRCKRFEKISEGLDIVNRNRKLMTLPLSGVRPMVLMPQRIRPSRWNAVMKKLKMPSLVGSMPKRVSNPREPK